MDTIHEIFIKALWFFAVAGFICVFSLAYIGFKMVYLAITFSLQYSYAEYQARKLKNASSYTRQKLSPDIDSVQDEAPAGKKEEKPEENKKG